MNLRNKERDSRVRNETNIQSEPNETFRKIDAKIERWLIFLLRDANGKLIKVVNYRVHQ